MLEEYSYVSALVFHRCSGHQASKDSGYRRRKIAQKAAAA
jgi:hypothetical protein